MKPKCTENLKLGFTIGALALAVNGFPQVEKTERERAIEEADQMLQEKGVSEVNRIRLQQLKNCIERIDSNYIPVYQVGYHALKDNKNPEDSHIRITSKQGAAAIELDLKDCSMQSQGETDRGEYLCVDRDADGIWESVSPTCSFEIISKGFEPVVIDLKTMSDYAQKHPQDWQWAQSVCRDRLRPIFDFIKARGTTWLDPKGDGIRL